MSTTMSANAIISLTAPEWEIIKHRLAAADALAGCLCDTFDHFTEKAVEAEAESLLSLMDGTHTVDAGNLTEMGREILRDCVEGSTFFASMEDAVAFGELSRGKALSLRKSAQSIERKFDAAGIATEGFPNY